MQVRVVIDSSFNEKIIEGEAILEKSINIDLVNLVLPEATFRVSLIQAIANPVEYCIYRIIGFFSISAILFFALREPKEIVIWILLILIVCLYGMPAANLLMILKNGSSVQCLEIKGQQIGIGHSIVNEGIENWMPVERVRLRKGLFGVSIITLPSDFPFMVPKEIASYPDLRRLLQRKQ
jgi:hypothetical protein